MNAPRRAAVSAMLAAVLLFVACQKDNPAPPAPVEAAPSAPAVKGAAAARVNGVDISRDEVEKRIFRIVRSREIRKKGEISLQEENEIKEDVLESLIEREMLYQDAVKHGFTAEPEDIGLELNLQRMKFASEEDFQKTLDAQGITMEDLIEDVRREAIINKYLQAFVWGDEVRATEEEARAFYGGLVKKFQQKKPGMTPPSFEAQKRQIYTVIEREKKDALRAEHVQTLVASSTIERFD